MLELKALIIADSVVVRDNLMSILNGGLTVFRRASFPAAFGADVALEFQDEDGFGPRDYEATVECLQDGSDETVFGASLEFGYLAGNDHVSVPRTLSIAVPFRDAGLPGPGSYRLRVVEDGRELGEVRFYADQLGAEQGTLGLTPSDELKAPL